MPSLSEKEIKPELLAPAGGISSAIAAFEAGADAVYCGLAKFNARERAQNFTRDDMSRVITYAHSNGRKVYVTFNTLVKESELLQAAEMIAEIAALRPDAVLVQDVGVLRLIREYFPMLAIHASTQMGIHNGEGVKMAARLGVSRVILERQLTFEEIRGIAASSPIEIEVFVHGALCGSLSGCCLLSSWMGGCSGNRGKCRQPCRHNYKFSAQKAGGAGRAGDSRIPPSRRSAGKLELQIPSGRDLPESFYCLSTRDLCLIDKIALLKEIGVASLKIEGRLRKPDYVRNVVSAYRLMLDCPKGREKEALEEARRLLELSHSRASVHGFESPSAFRDLFNPGESGVSGSLCGRVLGTTDDGFYARLSGKIHLGDRLRVQTRSGSDGTSFTLKRLSVGGKDRISAFGGEKCLIYCTRQISPDGHLFKIGESIDEKEAKIARLPLLAPKTIDLRVSVSKDGFRVDAGAGLAWEKKIALDAARTHSISTGKIAEEFASSCSNRLAAGKITTSIDGAYFLPLSVLKDIRREFWDWALEQIPPGDGMEEAGPCLENFKKDYVGSAAGRAPAGGVEETFSTPAGKSAPAGSSMICRSIHEFSGACDEVSLPFFCADDNITELRNLVRKAYGCGIRRFRITSLFHFALLTELKDVMLSVSHPLPCCNSLAACEFRSLGAAKVQAWPELEKKEILALAAKSPAPVEIYRYGRIPLFITRGAVKEGIFCDARGREFIVRKDARTGLVFVFSTQVLSIPGAGGCSSFYDLSNADLGEEKLSGFNYAGELL